MTLAMKLDEFKMRGIEEGRAEGISQGREEGRSEGEQNAKLETAKKMLINGKLTIQEISEITGLNELQIQQIKTEQ